MWHSCRLTGAELGSRVVVDGTAGRGGAAGDIRLADGRSWFFTDPCLTTWEAEQLSGWLAAASRKAADRDEAVFSEPSVSFCLDGHDGDRVRMRVRFSHESLLGLWPRAVAHWQACEYFVALEVGTADLAEAARVGPGPAAIPGPANRDAPR